MNLSPRTIKRLMLKHKVSMRQIKEKHSISLKRIREVRTTGVNGFMAENWFFIITGHWPRERS